MKRKIVKKIPLNPPSLPLPLPNPVPPPPDQFAQGPFHFWWDIENVPIPKWLKAEDVEAAFCATLSGLGYQGGAELEVSVAVESSTSSTIPEATQAKWAVLAKPGSIFKYKDCRANPREGVSYKKGQKDIADDEIIEQISLWTPPHQMGTTAVVISGDFKVLSQCEILRR